MCEELRQDFPDGLPIIMISANTDEASILKGLQVSDASERDTLRQQACSKAGRLRELAPGQASSSPRERAGARGTPRPGEPGRGGGRRVAGS